MSSSKQDKAGASFFPSSWEFWLAFKYVFSPKRERFTGIITFIAVLGVILSVSALTIVNAVITGFKEVITEKVLSLNPHLSIPFYTPKEGEYLIKKIEEIIPKKEMISLQLVSVQQGLIINQGQPIGIVLKAVDLSRYSRERGFKYFSYEKFKDNESFLPVIMGNKLKNKLGLRLGEKLNYLTLEGFYTPFGFFPKIYNLRVIGFFETGIYDYDFNLIFTSFEEFTQRLRPKSYSLEIKLKNPFESAKYKEELFKSLDFRYTLFDWQEWNRSLFSALKLEKLGLFIVLTLMVAVSLFTITSAMIMLVSEKKGDIGILKALGAESKSILKIFFYAGLLLSSLGVVLGMALGILIALLLSKYPVIKLPEDVYPVEYMPISLNLGDLFFIGITAIIISLMACLYPAKKASQFLPAEILRRE